MQLITLSTEERAQLILLARQIKDAKTAIRIRVILGLDSGYTIREVANILLLDEDTVMKYKQKYDKRQFFSDWLGDAYSGYDGKLTKAQEQAVGSFVTESTIADCAQVREWIKETYGITYTITGVTKLLHRLQFVYKQITLVPGKLDEAKQRVFLETYYQMKAGQKSDEVILFGDGVHPTHNIHKTKAWIKKGAEKQIKTNTGRGRLNINGALNLEELKVTTHFSDTINAEETMILFDKIQVEYSDKTTITLIIDNARYYKNKAVTEYLAKPGCRLKLLFLPSYSPNLNFIERLWKFMKTYIIGLKYRDRFKDFERDVHAFFDNISAYEEQLRPFLGTQLHLVKLTT
jgi:transposase